MANADERFPNLVPRVSLFKKAEKRDPGNEVRDNHFHFCHVIYRMLDRWVLSGDVGQTVCPRWLTGLVLLCKL